MKTRVIKVRNNLHKINLYLLHATTGELISHAQPLAKIKYLKKKLQHVHNWSFPSLLISHSLCWKEPSMSKFSIMVSNRQTHISYCFFLGWHVSLEPLHSHDLSYAHGNQYLHNFDLNPDVVHYVGVCRYYLLYWSYLWYFIWTEIIFSSIKCVY